MLGFLLVTVFTSQTNVEGLKIEKPRVVYWFLLLFHFYFFFVILGVKPKASFMLANTSPLICISNLSTFFFFRLVLIKLPRLTLILVCSSLKS